MAKKESREEFRKRMESVDTPNLKKILELRNPYEWSEKVEIIADIVRSREEIIPVPLQYLSAQKALETEQSVSYASKPQKLKETPIVIPLLILGLIMYLVCYMLPFYVVGEARYLRLSSEGHIASAIVTDLESEAGSDYEFTSYRAQYNFLAVVNGEQTKISQWRAVPDSIYNSLKVGQTIEVAYNDANPYDSDINYFDGGLIGFPRLIFCIIVILICIYFWPRISKKVLRRPS